MRGRPKDARPEETAARILSAAIEFFATQGYSGTSIRQVATQAETSVGTLQYHFATKDILYSACMNAVYDDMGGLIEAAYELQGLPIEKALELASIRGFRFAREHSTNIRLIYRELFDTGTLHPDVPRRVGETLLTAAIVIAAMAGGQPEDYTMALESAVFILVRYTLMSEDELQALFGLTEAPWDAVEAYLGRVLPKLVLMGQGFDR